MATKKKLKKKAVKKTAKKKTVKKAVKKITANKGPAKRKSIKKSPAKKKPAILKVKKSKDKIIGTITHYFPHVRAAVIKLKAPLSVGETIKIKGHTTDFTQTISSLQIDRVPVNSAKIGQEIGLLVNSRVRQHDLVYKV
jgi:putative protease